MKIKRFGHVLLTALLLTGFGFSGFAWSKEHHAEHQAHKHHQMTPEQFAELREKIEIYRGFTDAQIIDSMSRMRNMGGMISEAGVVGETGILALAHGYSDQGNAQWMEKFGPISGRYPTGYGLGMSMMSADHIQSAIDGLEAAGAKTILMLRTETGDTNSLILPVAVYFRAAGRSFIPDDTEGYQQCRYHMGAFAYDSPDHG
ncbi:MAG: hypothetical protein CL799_09115 [Chromatiales bacterium]|jgi:hypothetical protein|nr:hypothetical protein [Chromatiales bacterium]MDP6150365.1 hypothetical protein [Gammaproteobacteria bacterium]MDP7093258.1 hypothetical protein [Gammaproteobacteria bacterium]MDP7270818.1 hypothetical protein [Gammaproteobacteria bacterium]HJP04867.1 hypothetical protein [Gammaproteobacteria bacterium]